VTGSAAQCDDDEVKGCTAREGVYSNLTWGVGEKLKGKFPGFVNVGGKS
jgi:hypothetical protein